MSLNHTYIDFTLRPLTGDDQQMVLDWRNQENVRKYMYNDRVITPGEHARWIEATLQADNRAYFIFQHQGRPIGLVGFYDIDPVHRRADWAFYLGEGDVRKGSGAVMEYLALNYAFDELSLHKLCCEVFTFNAGVIKMHKRFGFVEEGHRVGHFFKDGEFQDIVELALFADHWATDRDQQYKNLFAPA
ncbi:MAG: UDP-4-amino-4,6-dideoxy-N-acetyl-beta-L-altrosamine N-acetyltransferase [Kordiimonas sp.]|nr:UDP-4-amino-4,6-dideoxy-N-acetyl-beta-L-altrosamine N-acetyltransferase [Kordiimonas sp.]|tara:strand:+ start:364 stop:927 length:564 start_codon:yes stop_codon:yes gene_type:complete